MSEMVERVAEAVSKTIDGWQRGEFEGFCDVIARAAIEAMREPTEAMVKEGGFQVSATMTERDIAKDVWAEMINAALGDETERPQRHDTSFKMRLP